jgi:two-component system CheB/CheR fusion protein
MASVKLSTGLAASGAPPLTANQQQDDALQRALLAAILESADDAIIHQTLQGQILSWSAGAERIFGYRAEEAVGRSITLVIPPELRAHEQLLLAKVQRGERIDHIETIRVAKDGRRMEVSLSVSPVRDSAGSIVGALKVLRNIDAEKGVVRLRAQLGAIVESSDDAIVGKTLEGIIQSWNGGASRIFGYSAAEAVGKPILLIVPPELHAEEQQILRRLRNGERIEHFDTIRLTKDGRRIPISLSVSPVRDAHGVIIGAAKIARDISNRQRAEQALRASEERLRQADRRKDEFLALLAHELRNPLAPIRYALATVRKLGHSCEQQQRAEEVIERQVAHMSRLLDDLLDASRITRGMLGLQKGRTELTTVLGTAIEAARPVLDAKRHALALDLPSQAVRLEADAVRLAQVFSNLLINAGKYTDPGGRITLRARQESEELVVSVRDNGIGIAADMMPRLFTLFSQAHGALARCEGGLGVGLALVRGIVTLHGGSVEAHSEGVGHGSEFVVRLPLGTPAVSVGEGSPPLAPALPGVGLKVLIVDDNQDAANTCAAFLELCGHHVQTAYTGGEALKLAEVFHPHVVLLDIGLPDVSGYELAKDMQRVLAGRNAVLIAVTGWGQEQDKRRALAAGFEYHLTKPIEAEAVESLLRSLGNALSAAPAGPS